jgi:hypothetical protein
MNESTVKDLIEYLKVLCQGKVRPDRKGGGVVSDAKFNIPDIEVVKKEINRRFNLSQNEIDRIKENQKTHLDD